MAKLTDAGSIIARCPGCDGGLSTFHWVPTERATPAHFITKHYLMPQGLWYNVFHVLFRCTGCGGGGLGAVKMRELAADNFPSATLQELLGFYPEARERFKLPEAVPHGIREEFREAERCFEAGCRRAAAGLFRSVLDKTMRANGYHVRQLPRLVEQIDAAAADGAITATRQKRAHEDIRALGNDVLHDEWEPISEEAVESAHHYAQRILEDFYDDRPTTLALLRSKNRQADEDRPAAP
jgi:Domain of unknown function (DUF4145)